MAYGYALSIMPYHPAESDKHLVRSTQLIFVIVSFFGLANILIGGALLELQDGRLYQRLAEGLSLLSPSIKARMADLALYGERSVSLYISSAITFLPVVGFSTVALLRLYKLEIIDPGGFRAFRIEYVFGLVLAFLLGLVTVHFCFFSDLELSRTPAPSMGFMMVYPVFGFFSSLGGACCAIWIMNFVAFSIKFRARDR